MRPFFAPAVVPVQKNDRSPCGRNGRSCWPTDRSGGAQNDPDVEMLWGGGPWFGTMRIPSSCIGVLKIWSQHPNRSICAVLLASGLEKSVHWTLSPNNVVLIWAIRDVHSHLVCWFDLPSLILYSSAGSITSLLKSLNGIFDTLQPSLFKSPSCQLQL